MPFSPVFIFSLLLQILSILQITLNLWVIRRIGSPQASQTPLSERGSPLLQHSILLDLIVEELHHGILAELDGIQALQQLHGGGFLRSEQLEHAVKLQTVPLLLLLHYPANKAGQVRRSIILHTGKAGQVRRSIILHTGKAGQVRRSIILHTGKAGQVRRSIILHTGKAGQVRRSIILHTVKPVR